jgi:hypothetical protein
VPNCFLNDETEVPECDLTNNAIQYWTLTTHQGRLADDSDGAALVAARMEIGRVRRIHCRAMLGLYQEGCSSHGLLSDQ